MLRQDAVVGRARVQEPEGPDLNLCFGHLLAGC